MSIRNITPRFPLPRRIHAAPVLFCLLFLLGLSAVAAPESQAADIPEQARERLEKDRSALHIGPEQAEQINDYQEASLRSLRTRLTAAKAREEEGEDVAKAAETAFADLDQGNFDDADEELRALIGGLAKPSNPSEAVRSLPGRILKTIRRDKVKNLDADTTARIRYWLGLLAAARLHFEEAVSDFEAASGHFSEDAVLRSEYGQALFWNGKPDKAEHVLLEAKAMLAETPDTDKAVLGTTLLRLGNLATTRNRPEEGLAHFAEAVDVLDTSPSASPRMLAEALNTMGLLQQTQHPEEAIASFRRAIPIFEAEYGKDSFYAGAALVNLSKSLIIAQRPAEALEPSRRALAVLQGIFDDSHYYIGLAYNNLALAQQAHGNNEEAVEDFRHAATIMEKLFGLSHLDVGVVYYNLGNLEASLGRFEPAIEHSRKAIETFKNLNQPQNASAIVSHVVLCRSLGAVGLDEESIREGERATQLLHEIGGDKSILAYSALYYTADAQLRQGRYEAALQHSVEGEKVLGDLGLTTDSAVYNVLFRHALALQGLERMREAALLFRRLEGMARRLFPASPAEFLYHEYALGNALFASGEKEEASEILEKGLAESREKLGEEHEITAKFRKGLDTVRGDAAQG